MAGETAGVGSTIPIPPRASSAYSPTRRTALILVGEGTAGAYLAGALKALEEAGVRFDLIMGKGAGALVAALGAIGSAEKLYGENGLIAALTERKPWRWRLPYAASGICLFLAFLVFVAPALVSVILLISLPLLAAARIVAPEAVAALTVRAQEQGSSWAAQIDPLYLRAMAFPLALLFAFLMVGWIVPALFRGSGGERGLTRLFGEGLLDLSPLSRLLERSLWEAVRGASLEARPRSRRDMGTRYRDLLGESLGQSSFRELIFYSLDQDVGQEVPFVLLKERWLTRLGARGPAAGAVVAEPVSLAGEDASCFFDALLGATTPASLAPSVPVRLPTAGRHGGEVHRFCSSLLAGQSAVADAVAAGAEQVIYVSGAAATGVEGSAFERLAGAAVRQVLEGDLRWAERERPGLVFFLVRPEKQKLGIYEFAGRSLAGGERLTMSALVAQGQRDAERLFIQPMVGEVPTQRTMVAEPPPTIQL
jgi:hypothetical protein